MPPPRSSARLTSSAASGPVDVCDVFHLDPAKVAALRTHLLGESAVLTLADTFKMLGDSTRVRILDALSRSELCVCDLARLLALTQSAVSHQLRLLRGMRLVRARRAGRMVFYVLDDRHIVRLFAQGLEHVRESTHHGGGAAPAGRRDSLGTAARAGGDR